MVLYGVNDVLSPFFAVKTVMVEVIVGNFVFIDHTLCLIGSFRLIFDIFAKLLAALLFIE